MKVVRIQALPREGYTARPRAGRFFPSGEAVTMEIVDQEDDPTMEVDATDHAGRPFKRVVPHPTRMSKKVFETMVMPDPVLKVLADGETIAVLSQAALDAARKQASDLAGELVDVKAKLAASQEKAAKLEAQVAELLVAVASVSPAPHAPPGPGEGDVTKVDESKPSKGSKSK